MKILKCTVVVIFLSLFIISGCKKDDGEDDMVPKYLVDSDLYTNAPALSADNLKLLLAQFGMSDLAEQVKYDINIHVIKYKTLFDGDTIIASGVVATPIALDKKETFPVVSYQHGTIFEKSECPSEKPTNEAMTYLASTGMVVVIADYVGFGASSAEYHPYMHNQYTVNAVLDMIRASKEFLKTEKPCDINDQLFLMGYSQGGSATLGALSAIENDISNNDIIVTAATAGGGAYDLNGLRQWIMKQQRYDKPSFVAYILESYSRYTDVGADYDFSLVFSDKLPVEIAGLIDGYTPEATINASFGTVFREELFNDNFENDSIYSINDEYAAIRKAFDDNKVVAWPVNTKLKIYHGIDDIWVPADQSILLNKEFQSQNVGSKVSLILLPGMNHTEAGFATMAESIKWFLDSDE